MARNEDSCPSSPSFVQASQGKTLRDVVRPVLVASLRASARRWHRFAWERAPALIRDVGEHRCDTAPGSAACAYLPNLPADGAAASCARRVPDQENPRLAGFTASGMSWILPHPEAGSLPPLLMTTRSAVQFMPDLRLDHQARHRHHGIRVAWLYRLSTACGSERLRPAIAHVRQQSMPGGPW
jgi:hypothetical protein